MASSSSDPRNTHPQTRGQTTSPLTPEQKLGIFRQIVGIPAYDNDGFGTVRSAADIERDAPDQEEAEGDALRSTTTAATDSPTNGKQPRTRTSPHPSPLLPTRPRITNNKRKKPGLLTRFWHKLLPYKDPPENKGIYHHILFEEGTTALYSALAYTLITFFLLLQVVVAAVITSLSAWGNHRIPLIALGATNTILASILAWLKGQGLPNRTLQYRYAMGRVRLQAELVDAKFQCQELAALLDPFEEGQHVVNMYVAAKSDAEKNQPDFYSMDSEWQAAKNRQVVKAGEAAKGGDEALRGEIAAAVGLMKDLVGVIEKARGGGGGEGVSGAAASTSGGGGVGGGGGHGRSAGHA